MTGGNRHPRNGGLRSASTTRSDEAASIVEAGGRRGGPGCAGVADRHQVRCGDPVGESFGVVGAHQANADDPDPQRRIAHFLRSS
nr:hypothetical protein [Sphaerimonospora thailandensis]